RPQLLRAARLHRSGPAPIAQPLRGRTRLAARLGRRESSLEVPVRPDAERGRLGAPLGRAGGVAVEEGAPKPGMQVRAPSPLAPRSGAWSRTPNCITGSGLFGPGSRSPLETAKDRWNWRTTGAHFACCSSRSSSSRLRTRTQCRALAGSRDAEAVSVEAEEV